VKALFAAGCFWGVEETLRKIPGILSTSVGYTGGHTEHPTYKTVCSGKTGHAEAVHIEYDPKKVSYEELLDAFFRMHDPTTLNRQGPDVGTQYRSAIFYFDEAQRKAAEEMKAEMQGVFGGLVSTEIAPAGPFYPAEEYHQKYYMKRGGGSCII
jgi:peptide-methionine (S)-S-oxide reductase